MKPRKPDRFERMVLKNTYPDMAVDKDDAIKFLRKEHAWVRRMVREVGKEYATSEGNSSAENLLRNILGRLDQRRK